MALTALLNLISANATQQGGSDRITGAELRAILNSIVNTIQSDASFSTSIPFDKSTCRMATHQLIANITLTPNSAGAVGGFGTVVRIIGGGSYSVSLSGFKKTSISGNFVASSGVVNVFLFLYDGTDYWYTVFQEAGSAASPSQLSTPSGFTATAASSTQVNLSWTDVSGESGYKLYRNTTNNQAGATLIASPAAGSTAYSDTGRSASTTYYYWLIAAGDGSATLDSAAASASATTSAASTPTLSAPVLSITSGTATPVVLDWADISGATQYQVQRADNSAFTANLITIATPSASTQSDATAAAGSTYYYRVKASGAGYNDSAYSNTVSVTIEAASGRTDGYTDVVYDTKDANLVVSNKIWDNSSNDTAFGSGEGLMSAGLTGDFEYVFTLLDLPVSGALCLFGLNDVATQGTYSAMKAGTYVDGPSTYTLRYINAGAPGDVSGQVGVAGIMLMIKRVGSTFTLHKSTDNGTTWSAALYTYGYTSSGTMYPIVDVVGAATCSNPKYKAI